MSINLNLLTFFSLKLAFLEKTLNIVQRFEVIN